MDYKNNIQTGKIFPLPNGMTLLEYLKSDAFKERIRKAREEYRKKHVK